MAYQQQTKLSAVPRELIGAGLGATGGGLLSAILNRRNPNGEESRKQRILRSLLFVAGGAAVGSFAGAADRGLGAVSSRRNRDKLIGEWYDQQKERLDAQEAAARKTKQERGDTPLTTWERMQGSDVVRRKGLHNAPSPEQRRIILENHFRTNRQDVSGRAEGARRSALAARNQRLANMLPRALTLGLWSPVEEDLGPIIGEHKDGRLEMWSDGDGERW